MIAGRATTLAVGQTGGRPPAATADPSVNRGTAGRVLDVSDLGGGLFEVRIALSASTVGGDAGQLINMLFGNTSIHDDVVLHDAELPAEFVRAFVGPRHGI